MAAGCAAAIDRSRRSRSDRPPAPASSGASHSSRVAVSVSIGPVGPVLAELGAQEGDPRPQLCRRRPSTEGWSTWSRATRSTSAAVVSGPASGRPTVVGQPQRSEPPLDAQHEVVAIAVPLEPSVLDDLGGEREGDVVGVERRRRGGSGRRSACRRGRRRRRTARSASGSSAGSHAAAAGAQLELPRSATAGEPVGIGEQQAAPGAVGVDASTSKRRRRRAGRGRRLARGGGRRRGGRRGRRGLAADAGATRSARSAGSSSVRPRSTSRSSTRAATTHDSARPRWRSSAPAAGGPGGRASAGRVGRSAGRRRARRAG